MAKTGGRVGNRGGPNPKGSVNNLSSRPGNRRIPKSLALIGQAFHFARSIKKIPD